ncbi:hypothetical protein [Amycolatopsis sp. NPDC003861]
MAERRWAISTVTIMAFVIVLTHTLFGMGPQDAHGAGQHGPSSAQLSAPPGSDAPQPATIHDPLAPDVAQRPEASPETKDSLRASADLVLSGTRSPVLVTGASDSAAPAGGAAPDLMQRFRLCILRC